jgi:hypothetical protein
MTSRAVTIAGYLLLLAAGVVLYAAGRRERSAVPSLDAVLARAMRTRPGRVALITGWAWVGLHFFAR